MAGKKKNDLAKVEEQETALAGAIDLGSYGDETGFEGCGPEDFAIPYFTVLQALSPQCQQHDAQYIEGAQPGMIINTVTKELIPADVGIIFQACAREYKFVQWKDRKAGGGIVAVFEPTDPFVAQVKGQPDQKFGKLRIGPKTVANDDDDMRDHLTETFYLVGQHLSEDDESLGQAMISFTATKIPVYKNLMSSMRTFMVKNAKGGKSNVPMYFNRIRLTTVFVDKGATKKYHNFVAKPSNGTLANSMILPPNDLLEQGQALQKMVASGNAKISHEGAQAGEAQGGGQPAGDVPF